MSDYDYDFDDDELYAWEDEVFDTADDLAEHTMHSPVYADVDPKWETSEYFSDWEYYSDDYYDNGRSNTLKQPQGAGKKSENKRKRPMTEQGGKKKRRLTKEDDIPALSLGAHGQEPTDGVWPSESVVWRKTRDERKPPVLEVGEGEEVALLKDWRDRFKDERNFGGSEASAEGVPMPAQKGRRKPRHTDDAQNTSALGKEMDLEPPVPKSSDTGTKKSPPKKLHAAGKQRGAASSSGRPPATVSNGNGEATNAATSASPKHSNASVLKKDQGTKRKAPDGEVDAPRTRPKRVTSTRRPKDESSSTDASAPKTTRSGMARRS